MTFWLVTSAEDQPPAIGGGAREGHTRHLRHPSCPHSKTACRTASDAPPTGHVGTVHFSIGQPAGLAHTGLLSPLTQSAGGGSMGGGSTTGTATDVCDSTVYRGVCHATSTTTIVYSILFDTGHACKVCSEPSLRHLLSPPSNTSLYLIPATTCLLADTRRVICNANKLLDLALSAAMAPLAAAMTFWLVTSAEDQPPASGGDAGG